MRAGPAVSLLASIFVAFAALSPARATAVDDAIKLIDSLRGDAKTDAKGQPPVSFVPPPRTIKDITAILDQEKPDPAKAAAARAAADVQPPANADKAALADFYAQRGNAAGSVGRLIQRRDDLREAVRLAREMQSSMLQRVLASLASAEKEAGDLKASVTVDLERANALPAGSYPYGNTSANIAVTYAKLGNFEEAKRWISRSENVNFNPKAPQVFRAIMAARVSVARAIMLETRGNFPDAERAYRDVIETFEKRIIPDEETIRMQSAASTEAGNMSLQRIAFLQALARTLVHQGRLTEAEAEARRGLLDVLKLRGHYASATADAVIALASIIYEQGRYPEAEQLAKAGLDIYQNVGHGKGSSSLANARRWVAQTETAQGKIAEARAMYAAIEKDIGDDADLRRQFLDTNLDYALVLLRSGQAANVVSIIENVVAKNRQNLGDKAFATAQTRGWLGLALAQTGQLQRAGEEFAAAMPILLTTSRETDTDDDGSSIAQRDRQTQEVIEAYLGLLADTKGSAAAAETFRMADAIRGQSVERALAASSARAAASDPALANLARHEQDAQKQIAALQGLLANILSMPTSAQDKDAVQRLREQIDQLRTARAAVREDIEKRFPDYANLIDPKPAAVEQAQKALKPGEALIATYVGADRLFVWAVPQQGTAAFASSKVRDSDVEALVSGLRKALDPQAETIEEVPAFDVAKAYKLYELLLKPVQAGWANAQSLLIVPHKSLGLLPASLLVTENVPQPPKAALPFAEYTTVPFLARKVAVTQLPSVTSLATLRALPPPKADRQVLAAFGDPWFSPQQANEAKSQVADAGTIQTRGLKTRGVPLVRRAAPKTQSVDSAELALLPRLPDTADEVKSVALALHADLASAVFLGEQANEKTVKTMNLANRKVVMFATHGLVPGDLNGLTQPALALSAPAVSKTDGDGLLTMEEILGLKLDADWVVLSACNTATGAGAGAEAVSGLGRAFFYAGTRALLVSNWPVETVSARTLTTDLFRRQAEKPGLARAEALRQAELALIDSPGAAEGGKPVFSYAHPIFWAPFSVVGDGG